jgi:hypothetical protein
LSGAPDLNAPLAVALNAPRSARKALRLLLAEGNAFRGEKENGYAEDDSRTH